MITGKYTDDYEILEADTALLPNETSDLKIHFKFDKFEFDLQMVFLINTESSEKNLQLKAEGTLLKVECTNFNAVGTGTTEPIEIATIDGKKLFINFWSYLLGGNKKKQRIRKIEYTILIER